MKFNRFMVLIAFIMAVLAGYGFYAGNSGNEYHLLLAVGAGISLFVMLSGVLAVSVPGGGTINIRVVSGIFMIIMLVEQLFFSFLPFHIPPYIIVTCIFLLLYIVIVYALLHALK
jgi:hypothetical protein